MKTSQRRNFAALSLFLAASTLASGLNASADTEVSRTDAAGLTSNRMDRKLGAYLGVSDPAPGLLGINIGYNLFDFMRLTAGYGKMSVTTGIAFNNSGLTTTESSISTFGAGAKFMVPEWSLSPTIGLNFAKVSYSGNGGGALDGFAESGSHVYTNFGLDWQAKSGFSAGAGYQTSLRSGAGGGFYLNAGWFFNVSG